VRNHNVRLTRTAYSHRVLAEGVRSSTLEPLSVLIRSCFGDVVSADGAENATHIMKMSTSRNEVDVNGVSRFEVGVLRESCRTRR